MTFYHLEGLKKFKGLKTINYRIITAVCHLIETLSHDDGQVT